MTASSFWAPSNSTAVCCSLLGCRNEAKLLCPPRRKSPSCSLMVSPSYPKSSLNICKFTVHILLKPGLENFEHYFVEEEGLNLVMCSHSLNFLAYICILLFNKKHNFLYPIQIRIQIPVLALRVSIEEDDMVNYNLGLGRLWPGNKGHTMFNLKLIHHLFPSPSPSPSHCIQYQAAILSSKFSGSKQICPQIPSS